MSFKIKAEKREIFGKNASRRLRREGMIPAILYGADALNVPLTLKKQDVFMILRSDTGENTVFPNISLFSALILKLISLSSLDKQRAH